MHLRPRLNSLEKNCLHNLSGVPNTSTGVQVCAGIQVIWYIKKNKNLQVLILCRGIKHFYDRHKKSLMPPLKSS
jgi:hypothetical protein